MGCNGDFMGDFTRKDGDWGWISGFHSGFNGNIIWDQKNICGFGFFKSTKMSNGNSNIRTCGLYYQTFGFN